MRQKRRWKCPWYLVFILQVASSSALDGDVLHSRTVQKSLFSPRMDYNQWKPLGRGDPLKNDPTFDYVPPVLDHVHYWIDPEARPPTNGENGQKTEILLLGVSSKKPAANSGHSHVQNQPPVTASDRRDTGYESYSKYYPETGPNHYGHHPNQRIARPNYFPSMTSQIIPSIMSLANRVYERTTFLKEKESRVPYTVLMPPPIVTKDPNSINQYSEPLLTTQIPQKPIPYELFTPSQPLPTSQQFTSVKPPSGQNGVTVQESNLIYQSTSLGDQKEFEAVPSISWELPSTTESNRNSFLFNQNLSPPKPFKSLQFSPQNLTNKILEASDSNHNINYVTPPPLNDAQIMFKGIVSDDNDLANTYVKIGKPEAQMDHSGMEMNNIHHMPIIFPHAEAFKAPNNLPPMSMQTIRDMETMKPPPLTQSPIYTRPTTPAPLILNTFYPTPSPEHMSTLKSSKPFTVTENPASFRPTNTVANILKKEHVEADFQSSNFIGSSSSITNTFVTTPKPEGSLSTSIAPTTSSETNTMALDFSDLTTLPPPSTTTTITTTESGTTTQTLTTDPLFKHYRQPAEPMRGPLYLIIQGHSKVKTYKPAKQIDGVMVQETNEIPYPRDRNIDYSIKHLHGFENMEDFLAKAKSIARERQARTGNLQTLKHVVQTGLGAVDFSKEEHEMLRRSDVDLQEMDFEVGYDVVDSKDMTSEKYHKGIVEEGRKLKT